MQGKKHAPTSHTPDAITSSKSQEFGSPVQKHQQVFQNELKLKLSKTSSPDGSKLQWVSQKLSSEECRGDGADSKITGRKKGVGFLPSPCTVVVNKFTESVPGQKLSNVDVRRVRGLKKNSGVDLKLSPRKGYVYVAPGGKKITPVKSAQDYVDDYVDEYVPMDDYFPSDDDDYVPKENGTENIKLATRSGKVFSEPKTEDLRLRTRRGTIISKPQSFDFAKKKLVNAKANMAAKKLKESVDGTKATQITTRTRRSKGGETLLTLDDLEKTQSKRHKPTKSRSPDDQRSEDIRHKPTKSRSPDDQRSEDIRHKPTKSRSPDDQRSEDIKQVKREMERKIEEERSKYGKMMQQMEEKQRLEIERLMAAVKQSNKGTRSLFGPVLKENINREEKKEPVNVKRPARRRSESSMLKDFHVETVRVDLKRDKGAVTTRSGISTRHSKERAANVTSQRPTKSKFVPTKKRPLRIGGKLRHVPRSKVSFQKPLGPRPSKLRTVRPESSKLPQHSSQKSSSKRNIPGPKSSKARAPPGPKSAKVRNRPDPKPKKVSRLAGPKSAAKKRVNKSGTMSRAKKRPKIDPCTYLFDDPQISMDVSVELTRCSRSVIQSYVDSSTSIAPGFPSLMVIGTIERVTDATKEDNVTTGSEARTNEIVLQPEEIKLEPVDHTTASGDFGFIALIRYN